MTSLGAALKDRLPPSDITQQQLKDRSWWNGPDLYVLIDDYDLIPGGSLSHPLGPLVEYLPQARHLRQALCLSRPCPRDARPCPRRPRHCPSSGC